jgi:energy-coupling factor transporter ATP-binding protein EcfA2
MIELAVPSGDPAAADSLSGDPALFDLYMKALDFVLAEPEIRSALDDFGLSGAKLRMKMVSQAEHVLSTVPQEYAAYKDVADGELDYRGTAKRLPPDVEAIRGLLNRLQFGAAVLGLIVAASGGATWALWPLARTMVWAGATVLLGALVLWLVPRALLGTGFGARLVQGDGSPALAAARDRLMAAVTDAELMAQARTFINVERRDRFGHVYAVAGSQGLSEIYDSANRVPTRIADDFAELLSRFDGASIGVAGPRGSGKSTLIRAYAEPVSSDSGLIYDDQLGWRLLTGVRLPERQGQDLRCLVSAPVNYAARDFVLHLFATFCRAVIDSYGKDPDWIPGFVLVGFMMRGVVSLAVSLIGRTVWYGGIAAILLYDQHPFVRFFSVPAPWVKYAAVAVICIGVLRFLRRLRAEFRQRARAVAQAKGQDLADVARSHLSRVRFLQTYTHGWSGALSLPAAAAQGQYSRGVSQAEQPLSYPEIVDEFRAFAREVAAEVHRSGHQVFIGVDELDKIGSPAQAEQFLNEIKGIFGIPYLYFMVSVSDDALTAFERRGLPLRDAFDSSFDEIIHVGPLDYAESRRLLYRRVIGLTEPYVALCHCLAGGLPRDLIRAARLVVRTAGRLSASASAVGSDSSEDLLDPSLAYQQLRIQPVTTPPTLADIATTIVHDEMQRKLRAISHAANSLAADTTELQGALYDLATQLSSGELLINSIDAIGADGSPEVPEVASLRLDFAAFAYYCATVQEVFTDRLDGDRITRATARVPGPASFDSLAGTRNAFALGAPLAWRMISNFRAAWSMETRDIARVSPSS